MKTHLQALLASALTLSAAHCVDPAIPERSVAVPDKSTSADSKPDAKPKVGTSLKLEL
ncbi:MAG: hypothetical protein OSB21_13915 [Myxococcota bacterium]|nr:hypothetical protein [Myxococcota bacterium]